MQTKKTFCSICSAFCGFEAEVEDNHILSFRPDTNHPLREGFSCTKGRQFPDLLNAKNRLVKPLKRQGKDFFQLKKSEALDQIAARLMAIKDQYGPESIALFSGNGVQFKGATVPVFHAWLNALGSHNMFSTMTIDQPAKIIATGRHGVWAGGVQSFESSDVAILVGNNVVVSSLNQLSGPPGWRPKSIKQAKKRGLKLIVIDPRLTETAQLADLHLAIKPGQDAVLLAGMIRLLIQKSLCDHDFCQQYTDDFAALKAQVEPYDLTFVAEQSGIDAALIEQAVDLFGGQKRGCISSGTGPDMGPHPNLSEHLICAMNTICGRHNRTGDKVNTSLLTPNMPPMEAVIPWDFLPPTLNLQANNRRSRIADARQVYQEMPSSTLADEILTPGKGQIKALIVIGGNPVLSLPDKAKIKQALSALDLLICIDVRRTDTTALADYILPASYGLERPEITSYADFVFDKPFHQFAEKLIEPPGDATEEWIYLAELAKRMGLVLDLPGGQVDSQHSNEDFIGLLEKLYPAEVTKVPIAEIASHHGGKLYEAFSDVTVMPALEGMDDKFQLMPEGVAQEFAVLAKTLADQDSRDDRFLLICRRNKYVYNSMCHELPKSVTSNPVYMHPDDILSLGAEVGDRVALESDFGKIIAMLSADVTLRRGVVASSHNFGDDSNGQNNENFASVSELLSMENSNDNYARMPIMTAVPITVVRA